MTLQKNTGAVRRFAQTMRFGAWLQALPNRLTPPPFRLMQIGSAFWQSRALYVAAQLDIATLLGDEALTADQLASRMGTHSEATGRLMRLLAAMNIFEECARNTFRNNKLSGFLRTSNPQNVRAMVLMHNAEPMSRPWFEQLESGIRLGIPPFYLSHGKELFAYLDEHPGFDKLFSEAMDTVDALAGDSFTTDFDWARFDRILDVGGSRGTKSLAILKRHPALTAIVIDRPQVIAEALRFWSEKKIPEMARLQFQEGDLFGSLPPAQSARDIYLLSAVLHGFDDEACVHALRNLGTACGNSRARIALMELVLPETKADIVGATFDMQMFMGTRGKERTQDEWKSLLIRGGMRLEEVVGLQSFGKILVARPER